MVALLGEGSGAEVVTVEVVMARKRRGEALVVALPFEGDDSAVGSGMTDRAPVVGLGQSSLARMT